MSLRTALARVGSQPAALWATKHVISPIDRLVVQMSGGRVAPLTSIAVPTLLLTTRGRRSGEPRTVPLVYVRDGGSYVVANARPPGERATPGYSTCGRPEGHRFDWVEMCSGSKCENWEKRRRDCSGRSWLRSGRHSTSSAQPPGSDRYSPWSQSPSRRSRRESLPPAHPWLLEPTPPRAMLPAQTQTPRARVVARRFSAGRGSRSLPRRMPA